MRAILAFLLFLCLLFIAQVSFAQLTRDQFYDSLNQIRQAQGLLQLRKSMLLEAKASNWLGFLHRHDLGMVHDNDTNDGEVLTNAQEYLAWWMASQSHRRVLLNRRYTRIGIAEKNGVWCARLN